ncbi:uronyl 2-sulfotransferase homolog pip-like [Oratosquilla oratoria]|uniref:uronyl 2-sulfotransferase homolog pip-like n=1 Tax=Oratosquilla oratoria TaxID=337810 RepID=UPI003F76060E
MIYNRVPKCGSTTTQALLMSTSLVESFDGETLSDEHDTFDNHGSDDCIVWDGGTQTISFEDYTRVHAGEWFAWAHWPHNAGSLDATCRDRPFHPSIRYMVSEKVEKLLSDATQGAESTKMEKRNSFIYKLSDTYDKHRLDAKEQKKLVARLYRKTRKGAKGYDRHMYYFNVSRFGYPRPVMVNLIRDPVERFISNFYFMRSDLRWRTNGDLRLDNRPPKSWFEKNLDTCIGLSDPECLPVRGKLRELQLSYFCGHHPGCLQVGNHGALQRAKRHVENYYSVVALLEEYLLSFKVLEEYVPRFFANVTSEKMSSGTIKKRTTSKAPVSNSTKNLLRNMLKEDVEFYDFARQRLHKQANALGIL